MGMDGREAMVDPSTHSRSWIASGQGECCLEVTGRECIDTYNCDCDCNCDCDSVVLEGMGMGTGKEVLMEYCSKCKWFQMREYKCIGERALTLTSS